MLETPRKQSSEAICPSRQEMQPQVTSPLHLEKVFKSSSNWSLDNIGEKNSPNKPSSSVEVPSRTMHLRPVSPPLLRTTPSTSKEQSGSWNSRPIAYSRLQNLDRWINQGGTQDGGTDVFITGNEFGHTGSSHQPFESLPILEQNS